MAFTLLHTADLHLGKSFCDLPPERAGQRRADLLATLSRVCRKARELTVDVLCIAGDLFDRPPAAPVLASVRRALAEASVPVVLVPGNHDPLEEGSPLCDGRWPGNVLVAAQPGWQRLPVKDIETWAFGYARGEAHRNPWRDFPGCGTDALLVLHAACLGAGLAAAAGYYPFTVDDIPACGYLALGHHHRPAQVSRAPMAWYAGAPEPLEAEIEPAVALHVTRGGAAVEPLRLSTRRHRLVELEVSGLSAEAIWDRALAAAAVDDLLTLKLTGVLEVAASLDLSALRAELSARCFGVELQAEHVQLPADIPAGGVLGALGALTHRRLETLPADDAEGRARLERAMRYAALALEGKL